MVEFICNKAFKKDKKYIYVRNIFKESYYQLVNHDNIEIFKI